VAARSAGQAVLAVGAGDPRVAPDRTPEP